MIFVHPDLAESLDTDLGRIHTIIVEKPSYYYSFLNALNEQMSGTEGAVTLFDNDKQIPLSKGMEILNCFVPFDINKKVLVNRIVAALEKNAVSESFYLKSMELLSATEKYMNELAFDFPCDIVFPKLSVSSLIKAASPELRDDYSSLPEKLLDYFELVQEFDRRKLFVTVNLRSFISENEFDLFAKSIISHGYNLLMLENVEYKKSKYEIRHIIDADLCQIDLK